MRNFLAHTDADRQAMLRSMGLSSLDDLFSDIPESLRRQATFSTLPAQGWSELEVEQELGRLGKKNSGVHYACFLGAGAYNRYIPAVVNTIASRSEFATSYTPYQPEISQGTLQVIYEFQSMMAELTAMDVVNASVYDAASAITEAAFMAVRIAKRSHLMVANTLHPDILQVLKTNARSNGNVNLHLFDPSEKPESAFQATGLKAQELAGVILANPSFIGTWTDPEPWNQFCQENGALFVVQADPISLGVVTPPGTYGADIVVGDIQPLGNNMAFGGPYGGFIATRSKHIRQIPGRLVGRSVDETERSCFTLTLQTREQHIRREKATSNICTNQALNMLRSTVYLSLMGPEGLRQVAHTSIQRAHYLANALTKLPGVSLTFPQSKFLWEFAVTFPMPADVVLKNLEAACILGGISLDRYNSKLSQSLLIAVTEKNTVADLNKYIEVVDTLVRSYGQSQTHGPGSSSILSNPERAGV